MSDATAPGAAADRAAAETTAPETTAADAPASTDASARIDRLWPEPATDLDDAALLEAYAFPADGPWLRMNFIASIDGAATRQGRSGGLGDAADRRVFDLLRHGADAVLVGAGTVRTEGYGAMRLDDAAVAWRRAHDLPDHPVFALVTRSLGLDPRSSLFADAPVRPVIYTVEGAAPERRAALEAVADVVDAGDSDVDPQRMRDDLAARGLLRVHAEGGPSLFGSFLAADAVDELCLTLAPTIEAGDARRIAHSTLSAPTPMTLASVLRSGDELLLRYTVV
ncbi:Pyrimidine reductase, riboflavin biosynthesis [Agrococcus baldri]|uniref:Pyrimidine reductase, riboflavin biosynthesis n=1 Tax=Agrococcus baldri TaxID=153730 RepID=A0AA94HLD7_9MICO|nr:pyrimidine reductase family protein [Agrococcus baldri]SFS00722.1 Pyrimidine reductase, riboflavin biosynthesis [Agrococcus baldri]